MAKRAAKTESSLAAGRRVQEMRRRANRKKAKAKGRGGRGGGGGGG